MARAWSAAAAVLAFLPVLGQDNSAVLCGGDEGSPQALAARLRAAEEGTRATLVRLAESPAPPERLCGIVGLAVLDDRRAVSELTRALSDLAMRQDAYRLARAAAYLAAAPDPELGATLQPLVDAVADPDVWRAAGADAIWLLGEVDHPSARARLLAELETSSDAADLDAVIHALARQGEARARERVAQLGAEALRAKSGNATPEQARRLGSVAFYQLAQGPESAADGFATLATIALRDQQEAASWAVHTLCARAVRRPADGAALDRQRASLVAELDRMGIGWQSPQGRFGCESDR